MADILSKRSISDVDLSSDYNDDSKKSAKPGRKPLKSEPKNKRTAQNRAAQRAFRERKEKRMKELEDKVEALENQKIQATTESEFLRAQVEVLIGELSKYRGSDAEKLDFVKEISANIKNAKKDKELISPSSSHNTSISNNDSISTDNTSTASGINNNFTFEFPWSKNNLQRLTSSNLQESQVPGLSVASCSSVSNSSNSPNDDINYTLINENNPIEKVKDSGRDTFDFDNQFDEIPNPFCESLNEACGTKDCPVPKCGPVIAPIVGNNSVAGSNLSSPAISSLNDSNSPFSNLLSSKDSTSFLNNTSNYNINDPLSFLNDNAFDSSLAFDFDNNFDNNMNLFNDNINNFDPISMLTTEESVYDPLGSLYNPETPNDIAQSVAKHSKSAVEQSIPIPQSHQTNEAESDDDDDEVVPSGHHKFMKCSEIWDRITAHPRYSDIDIDGLCQELKAKAKCSEKGVVISSDDVTNLLNRN